MITFLMQGAGAATAGIGILKKTGSAVLKIELDCTRERRFGSKTISNPKLFTLDNQASKY